MSDGLYTLIGVVIGAAISIFGNWLMASRESKLQIKNILFSRRLDAYMRLKELLSKAEISQHSRATDEGRPVPMIYLTHQVLGDWINTISPYVAANSLILDIRTLRAFAELNAKILADLKSIAAHSDAQSIDINTKLRGLDTREDLGRLTTAVHDAAWTFFKSTYDVEL